MALMTVKRARALLNAAERESISVTVFASRMAGLTDEDRAILYSRSGEMALVAMIGLNQDCADARLMLERKTATNGASRNAEIPTPTPNPGDGSE